MREGDLNLSIVGLGRIGLPTASLFAESGVNVIGVDIDPKVVEDVNNGVCRLTDEPGLNEILKAATSSGRLKATTDIQSATAHTDVIIVCVPTPVDGAKTPDYSAITSVLQGVGRNLRRGVLIIIESTVGPGVVEELCRQILEEESGLKAGVDFGLASCPERADPGCIVGNMKKVPRIVGGWIRRAPM